MYAEIKAKINREIPDGTLLHVLIPGASLTDHLKKLTDNDVLLGELRINDGRTIRADQRRKLYATIRDICDWNGDLPEWMKEYLKYTFMENTGTDYFSLSNCSVTTARHFISHVLDFALLHGVPLSENAIDRTDDIGAYLYSALLYKRCCVCGKNAHLHHTTPVGMGRNRQAISHLGMEVMALCPVCHDKCHRMGQESFDSLHHVYGIKANQEICEKWGLKTT